MALEIRSAGAPIVVFRSSSAPQGISYARTLEEERRCLARPLTGNL